ncbi:DJ-1/PfpI family protein [Enterococcus saccharolyticus]|uniref:DJ-1/PfpI family protein n=1 Tax=Enterococcus saccharolyticus TaxID=41997 RepID=UPI001E308042|nr:DJ-1/PfpI family protein [Enterococcus saccharolyticus]MCD5003453.1 DJ-1/PfpI family protein [Enterococcus saccharolyticus]
MKTVNFLVFNQFETLDLFGVVEIFGRLPQHYTLYYYSLEGGIVTSRQQVEMVTKPISELDKNDILIVPGGLGTRTLVADETWIAMLKTCCQQAKQVLTICTGAALVAKTGMLNGQSATSNKRAMDWVISTNEQVNWQRKARWVVADKFYTSSGVSAGMDMALGFIADQHGKEVAEKIAYEIEYVWNSSPDEDCFVEN